MEAAAKAAASTIWRRLRCSTRSGLPLDLKSNTQGSWQVGTSVQVRLEREAFRCCGLPRLLLHVESNGS